VDQTWQPRSELGVCWTAEITKINIETNSVLIRSRQLALLQPEVHNPQSQISRFPDFQISRFPDFQILAVNANQDAPPLALKPSDAAILIE
jgi:hypothetical protein